jgi:TubC N-terminal docking domain
MNAFDLLVEIDRLGISIEVNGDTLHYQGALTPEIKAQLQRHKADILKYVSVQVIDRAMPRDAGVADSQRGSEARTVRARRGALPHTRLSDNRGHCGAAA